MPSAKRAVLKSLVREIRTQGSARGQSGNWLFYLDVRQAKLVIFLQGESPCLENSKE